MNGTELLTGAGGGAGFAIAIAYVIVQLVNGRRESRSQPSGLMTDAATTNTILTNSMHSLEERVANAEKSNRQLRDDLGRAWAELAAERERHRVEIEQIESRHKTELAELRTQLNEVNRRLAAAEARYEDSK